MNVAIGIGTMLLSGWLINTPASVQQQQAVQTDEVVAQETTPTAPAPMIPPSRMRQGTEGGRSDAATSAPRRRDQPTDDIGDPRGRASGGASSLSKQGRSGQQLTKTGMMTPLNPTETPDESAASGMNLPTPPTSSDPLGAGMPMAPTQRRPTRSQLLPDASGFQGSGGAQQSIDRSAATSSREKAFSQARPISSGVSPWQNLFRNDTAGGTIDNYTTLVRPTFDQQNRNQQFTNDIYGLERSARIQNSQLQQLNRGTQRSLQGIATPQFYMRSGGGVPQYYMNYGNYYQSGQGSQNGQSYLP